MEIELTQEELDLIAAIEAAGPERLAVFRQHLTQLMQCYTKESQTFGVLVTYHGPSEQLMTTVIHGDSEMGAAMLHNAFILVSSDIKQTPLGAH